MCPDCSVFRFPLATLLAGPRGLRLLRIARSDFTVRFIPAGAGISVRPFARLHRLHPYRFHRGRVKTPGLHLRFRCVSFFPFVRHCGLGTHSASRLRQTLPGARFGFPDSQPLRCPHASSPLQACFRVTLLKGLRDRRAQRILSVRNSSWHSTRFPFTPRQPFYWVATGSSFQDRLSSARLAVPFEQIGRAHV